METFCIYRQNVSLSTLSHRPWSESPGAGQLLLASALVSEIKFAICVCDVMCGLVRERRGWPVSLPAPAPPAQSGVVKYAQSEIWFSN